MKSKKIKKEKLAPTVVTGCAFYGVKWDGDGQEAVLSICRAIENMTKLFSNQNIHIDSLLKIEGDKDKD